MKKKILQSIINHKKCVETFTELRPKSLIVHGHIRLNKVKNDFFS